MPFLRRHWPVFLLALLPLTVLWRAVFLGECIGPWDQIMQMAPWNQPKPSSAWDVLQADGVLQFYGWRDLVFESWGKGQAPLWNPYQLCGTPLLANSQSAPFYPLHILMGLLHVPTVMAITLLAWFHLAWAALGTRWLAKLLGANEYGAVTAGACFGMSAFMVSWTPLASVVTTCSWIPWVLGFACLVLRGANRQSTSDNPQSPVPTPHSPFPIPLLALSIGMMLLGGHLQFAAYGLIALFVFGLVLGIQNKAKWTAYAAVFAALVIGGMLSAPQVLPSVAFSRVSSRNVPPTPEGAAAYGASALQLPELSGVFIPAMTGLPGRAVQPQGWAEPVPSYWPAYVHRGAAFAEGALGIGIWVLALLLHSRRTQLRSKAAAIAVLVTATFLAFGPLSLAMYWVAPGWSSTGSPGRASVLIVLTLCLLAGLSWPTLDEDKSAWPKFLQVVFLGLVGSGLLTSMCASVFKPWFPGIDDVSGLVRSPFFEVVPIALACLAAIWFALRLSAKSPTVSVLIGVATTLLVGSLFCLPTGRVALEKQTPDPATRNAFVNSNWGLLQAAHAVMPGNMAGASRLYDVAGYDSLLHRDSLEMLRAVNAGKDPAPDANGNMMFVKPGFDLQKLMDAGVSTVWSLKPLDNMPAPPELDGNVLKYRLPGPGRAYTPQGSARITDDGFDHQTVEADGPGPLVVKDRNMPGWSAQVDDKPAVIKEGLWREVDLPPGSHTVRFTYEPPGLRTGGLLGLIAKFGLITLVLVGKAKGQLSKHKEGQNGEFVV